VSLASSLCEAPSPSVLHRQAQPLGKASVEGTSEAISVTQHRVKPTSFCSRCTSSSQAFS